MKTLTDIKKILSLIQERHNTAVDLDAIQENDKLVLQLFRDGKAPKFSRFYEFMKKRLQELQPTCFEDIVAISVMPLRTSIFEKFVERKHNAPTTYNFTFEEKYLSETYGLLLYHEQQLQIVQEVTGFSKEQSEEFLNSLMLNQIEDIWKMGVKFRMYALRKGYSKEEINKIWETYFYIDGKRVSLHCKASAVSFAWLWYQYAYLKAHYPEEYAEVSLSRKKK